MKKLSILLAITCAVFTKGNITQPVTSAERARSLIQDLLIHTEPAMTHVPYREPFNRDEQQLIKLRTFVPLFNAAITQCRALKHDNNPQLIEKNIAQCLVEKNLKSEDLFLISQAVRIEDTAFNMSRPSRYFLDRIANHVHALEEEAVKKERNENLKKLLDTIRRQAYYSCSNFN